MPYIQDDDRYKVDKEIDLLITTVNRNGFSKEDKVGVANYIISRILMGIIKPSRYNEYNSAIGVLECAKLELYRRMIAPYEDDKICQNGDIQPYC